MVTLFAICVVASMQIQMNTMKIPFATSDLPQRNDNRLAYFVNLIHSANISMDEISLCTRQTSFSFLLLDKFANDVMKKWWRPTILILNFGLFVFDVYFVFVKIVFFLVVTIHTFLDKICQLYLFACLGWIEFFVFRIINSVQ